MQMYFFSFIIAKRGSIPCVYRHINFDVTFTLISWGYSRAVNKPYLMQKTLIP